MESQLYFADQNYHLVFQGDSIFCKRDGVPNLRDSISTQPDGVPIKSPLKGAYQNKNFITAFQAIELLKNTGFLITDSDISAGFKNIIRNTGLMGRWQQISDFPRVICDVGHNEAGIRLVLEQLRMEKFEQLRWVFGLVNDKDADSILNLMPKDAVYYFCKANIPRGLDVEELKLKAQSFGLKGKTFSSVKNAYQAALADAGDHDLVFVGGSTFVVAEVL
jgi:dihydrofolate synthase/folylpolyglutamate synthase